MRKFLKRLELKFPQHGKGNNHPSPRNTEVQINEEEIGKQPEKELRIMIVNMIENLESKREKTRESNATKM